MPKYLFLTLFFHLLFLDGGMLIAGTISGIGKIEPKSGIIEISSENPAVIDKIYVRNGELIKKNQLLVSFDNQQILKQQLDRAKLELKHQKVNAKLLLAQQQLHIEQVEQKSNYLRGDFENYANLDESKRVKREFKHRKHIYGISKLELANARLKLKQIQQDVEYTESRCSNEIAIAKSRLNTSLIKSPIDGVVLDILKYAGELANRQAIVKVASLAEIYVDCEVLEYDLPQLKLGMRAEISSDVLPKSLKGNVIRIGRIINNENKLGRVMVRLDSTEQASNYLDMEVIYKLYDK